MCLDTSKDYADACFIGVDRPTVQTKSWIMPTVRYTEKAMEKRPANLVLQARLWTSEIEDDISHGRIGLAAKRAEALINIATQLAIWCYDRQREFDAKAKAVING